MTNSNQVEKRKFVRIRDHLLLAVRTVEEATQIRTSLERQTGNGETMIGHELKALNDQIVIALHNLGDKMPKTALALSLLNKKVNLLAHHVLRKEVDEAHRDLEVSLSAAGIGFYHYEKLEPGEIIALDIMLKPNPYRIIASANIVSSDGESDIDKSTAPDSFNHYVRAEFNSLSTQDEEILIQHVLRKEGELLKQKRLSREEDDYDDE